MKTLATGRRVDLPVLYSTAARYTVSVKRPAVLTSGKLPNLAPDLAERTVLLPLERRADSTRRTETDLNEHYRRLRPRLLAVLLDDIAGILRNRRAALLAGRRLHRMADVSLALHALDIHLGLAENVPAATETSGRPGPRGYCAGMVINGSFSLTAGVRQREEKHDRGERAFRLPVAVVNPEPVVAVMHGGKRVRRLVLAAVNPHRLLAAPPRRRFRNAGSALWSFRCASGTST